MLTVCSDFRKKHESCDKITKKKNKKQYEDESRNLMSIIVLFKKIISWYALLHDFYMFNCPNLMTKFNEGRGTDESKQLFLV